nr:hypothetical protein [Micromonospora sp. DSM 115978]
MQDLIDFLVRHGPFEGFPVGVFDGLSVRSDSLEPLEQWHPSKRLGREMKHVPDVANSAGVKQCDCRLVP